MKTSKTVIFTIILLSVPALIFAGGYNKSKTGHQASAAGMDIVDTAVSAGQFNTLAAALKAADLVDTLRGDGPFTVFAPTDDAFAKLPEDTLKDLLRPENKAKLQSILTYHVVSGKVMAKDVTMMSSAKTVNGGSFQVSQRNGSVMIDNAKVIKTDVMASNGVIHVIDTVIIPK